MGEGVWCRGGCAFLDREGTLRSVSLTFYPSDGDPVTLSFAGLKGLESVEVTAKGYQPTGATAFSVCDSYAALGILSITKPSTKKESD